jgi:hypothetical protein
MKQDKPEIVELEAAELEKILQRAESRNFRDEDYKMVIKIISAYVQVCALLQKGKMSIKRLKNIIFGSKTEKTSSVLGGKTKAKDSSSPQDESAKTSDNPDDDSDDKPDPEGGPADTG